MTFLRMKIEEREYVQYMTNFQKR